MGDPYVWTGTAALSALRRSIGDPDPGGNYTPRWSDAELVDYLNRAQLHVALECEVSLKAVWSTDLVDGQREYKLPPNFFKSTGVDYVAVSRSDVRPLTHLTWQEYRDRFLSNEDAEGEPCWYHFWRKTGDDPTTTQPPSIYIFPTPGTNEDGNAIEVHGFKHPDAISSGDLAPVLELEAPYVEAALTYASMLVAQDDSDHSSEDRRERRFLRQVDRIRQSLALTENSSVSHIRARGSRHRRVGRDGGERYWTPWG
jgi:hypothetical protein